MNDWLSDVTKGKNEVLGENTVPVPLCPQRIPHELAWVST